MKKTRQIEALSVLSSESYFYASGWNYTSVSGRVTKEKQTKQKI